MWDKLLQVEQRYEELADKLSSPEVIKDRALFSKLSKEHKDLTEVVATYRSYRKAKEEMDGSVEIANTSDDASMIEAAQEEMRMLKGELEGLENRMRTLLIPKDPNDDKNVIMEIRAGAGGDEAGIFAGDLFRLYSRYVEGRKWKMELLGTSEASAGGFKEVICMVSGAGAYSRLKYEKGVHRVQRVPKTETQGRIHTSTVTVAVLPEAEEVEIQIEQKDLRIDVYRAGGPGGQSVNTTDSAVRITHIPTGVVVAMQDEKSQLKNRDKAMRVLRARLYDFKQAQLDAERSADRRSQQGTGDRSEKVRTYNYPQSRVTDHRIGLSLYSLAAIMDGDLDQLIDPMAAHEQAEALQGGTAEKRSVADDD
jgi:peptide chain release factor 1